MVGRQINSLVRTLVAGVSWKVFYKIVNFIDKHNGLQRK